MTSPNQPLGFEREAREIASTFCGLPTEKHIPGECPIEGQILSSLQSAYREGRRNAEAIFSEGEIAGFCQGWNACKAEAKTAARKWWFARKSNPEELIDVLGKLEPKIRALKPAKGERHE